MQNKLISLATMYLSRSQFKEAENVLHQELAANPQNPYACALLGIVLAKQGQKEEARQAVEQALVLDPDDSFNHYAMAVFLDEQGKLDDALAKVQQAILMAPFVSGYYAKMSGIYLQKRDWKQALEAAEAGRRLDPDDVDCANM